MRSLLALFAALGVFATGTITAAPPAGAADGSQSVTTARYAGADRFATSVEVSRQTPTPGDVVYLASGLSFADALAAGPVAAAEGGHLLLTRPEFVDDAVMQRIIELSPSEVVLVGSAATVHESVRSQLTAALPGTRIERVGGIDRVGTSLLLLERLESVTEVWVVSGFSFPDALVAASVAGATGGAIVLDHHRPDAASARSWGERVEPYINGIPVSIAGGTPSVSAEDEALLFELGAVDIVRHAGTDRYDTARLINDAYPVESDVTSMLLATGENFPDALAGAVHAAATGMPLYLSPKACHPVITPMLAAEAAERGVTRVVGLGSSASLADDALSFGPCFSGLQAAMGDRYGTFPTTTLTGTGDARIPLPAGSTGGLIHFSHGATDEYGGFFLTVFTREGLPTQYLGGDGYEDRQTFAYLPQVSGRVASHLDIDAHAPWSITFEDLRHTPELVDAAAGAGDDVLLYDGESGPLEALHAGDNFSVRQCADWSGTGGTSCRAAITLDGPGSGASHSSGHIVGQPSIVIVDAARTWELYGPAALH